MSGTVDDLSDSDEDDFPPGFLTSNLTEERDSDEEFDAPLNSGAVVETEVPSRRPQASVEFTPLLYREKKCVLDYTPFTLTPVETYIKWIHLMPLCTRR
jgi:hypothetical protein